MAETQGAGGLELSVRHRPDGSAVLVAAGEIDMTNAELFRQALATTTAHGGTLTVDLSAVDYLDSAGLAALFARAVQTPTELIVNDLLRPVLEISGLTRTATLRN